MRRLADRRWLLAMAIVSCLVHLSLFAAAERLVSALSNDRVERSSVRVALGSTGAAPGQIEQQPATETAEPVPEPPVEDIPEEVVTETPEVVEPAPEETPPEPDPEPEPEPEPVEAPPEPEPPAVQDVTGSLGLAGESDPSDQVDTEGDTRQEGFEAPYDYDGAVLAHLSGFRQFPMQARMRREQGEVGVAFVIDRAGRVLRARITEGSGSRRLDRAALDQIDRAAPFPQAPPEVEWTERSYRATIRFELR
ncbi:MAG: energy transducer TonB [Wenzhouxiangella sp.]